MKKTFILLLMALTVIAATAQTIGEAFFIYRNDGGFNAFFRDEVDSIAYSHFDTDSIFYDEIVTQLVYTADSVYRIPLAVIDSVGFVQPETVYREDVKPLVGELFDYLIKADSLLLTFSSSIPATLIPKIDDKIVATELTDKLPNGFTGKVSLVENGVQGVDVYCDSLAFEETVSQFYGVLELVSQDGASVRRYMDRKAPVETHNRPINFIVPEITIPVSLEGCFTPRDAFGIGGKATWTIGITPTVTGRMVRVVDDRTRISYINLHAIADVKTSHTIEIAGVMKNDHDAFPALKNLWFHKDIPTPWGVPVYVAFGPLVEASGELAVGTTVYADFRHTMDVTLYPATIPNYMMSMNPLIRALFSNVAGSVNTVDHDVQATSVKANWSYFAARGGVKVGGAARLGLALGKHEVAWLGGEGQTGMRADAEINVDFDGIANAEDDTTFYETLKSNTSLTIMPYWGIQFVVSGLDDQIQLKVDRDNYTLCGARWKRDFLPVFSDTKAVAKGSSGIVSANITNNCLFPYTVGFSLCDENNNRIGEPHWSGQKYRLHKDYNFPFETSFTDLATDKMYKAYPTLRLCGFNVLASPSADLDMHFPVTLSDFKVMNMQHKENGFTHNGQSYDYCFNVSITAVLDDDAENIADWGYVYLDPNGQETIIPLSGHSYTDTRYAYYRDEAKSTCTLYGYVKYAGSNETVYGEPHDFPLEYVETACPDSNHPHMIDMGLPSGTQWACSNVGASTPEGYGNYYAWGETQPKSVYSWEKYAYWHDNDGDGHFDSHEIVHIGYDISGTGYDAATANLGAPWHMPTLAQIQELLSSCTSTWTIQNGVDGRTFVGPNGNTIFLPLAGNRWNDELSYAGSNGYYWSSTLHDRYRLSAYGLYLYSGNAYWYGPNRYFGLPVRPVR